MVYCKITSSFPIHEIAEKVAPLVLVLLLIVAMQEILVDRAVHAAVSRFLSSHVAYKEHETPILVKEDFSQAMHDFVPVAMRGLTKAASEGGRSGWEDVGGLVDIRIAIQEVNTTCFPCVHCFHLCIELVFAPVLLYLQ